MPILKNVKHEAYAQGLNAGLSADEAYIKAGFKPNRGNACRLKANENIIKRVAELQKRGAKKAEVTIDSLCLELEQARVVAIKESQSSAAVSATMGKAKLFGLGFERHEHTGKDGGPIKISGGVKIKAYLDALAKRS